MKVKSKRHKNVHYEYFWSKAQKSYTIKFWIGVQGFTLNHRPDTRATRDWYFDRLDDAFETMIRNQSRIIIPNASTVKILEELEWLERAEVEWFKNAVEKEAHIERLEDGIKVIFNKWSRVVQKNRQLRKKIKELRGVKDMYKGHSLTLYGRDE